MQNEDKYMTLTEVAKLLGLSQPTATKWARLGRFLGCHRVGRTWIFRPDFKVIEEHTRGRSRELLNRLVPPPAPKAKKLA